MNRRPYPTEEVVSHTNVTNIYWTRREVSSSGKANVFLLADIQIQGILLILSVVGSSWKSLLDLIIG